jgi:hypothetical protein
MPKNIHTVYKDGKWISIREGQDKPLSSHETKKDAEIASVRQAKKDKVEHVIHGRDGKIQDKDSYGNDPNPPKDKKH